MIPARPAFVMLLALFAAACGREPAVKRPPLPVQERPVLTLAASPDQLRIPRAALVERGGIPGVFVLDAQSEARFRMVRPGHADGERVIILAGLQGRETLVLGDLRVVRDGTPIRPLPARRTP